MITGAQSRAARALVEISRETLAALAATDAAVIERFERKLEKPDSNVVSRIKQALEEAGAVFIAESETGSGAGVHLKFNSSLTRRIATLEGEGGVVRPDDIP